jgi:hypothetical protein
MKGDTLDLAAGAWTRLETHFHHHALLVERFRHASPSTVVGMWRSGRNEAGERLSGFEREALIERYCELFGVWPS